MRDKIRDINSARNSKNAAPPRPLAPRRLAAIVAGDIAGYSRLMELDEEGTHGRVKRIERDLIEPSIVEHHGRLVKTTGDGFMAIFDSPVEAVRCGIVIQQNMQGRNASLPKSHWIEFRIGVNLGDVIIEEDDVYGDGVNIASRLEGIAQPGEVFISGGIYEQIKNKLVCGYESLGDRKVKNITDPVRVYRVLPDPAAFSKTRRRRENMLIFLLASSLLCAAGGALWYMLAHPNGRLAMQAPVEPVPAAPHVPSPAAPNAAQSASPSQPAPSQSMPSPNAPSQPAPNAQQAAVQNPPAPAPALPAQPPAAPAAAAPQAALQPQPVAPPAPTSAIPEPDMQMVRGGAFTMGSNEDASERPVHQVTLKPFAISRYPISVREWNACAAAKACGFTASGKEDAPITNVSWSDAKRFAGWLATTTGKAYRLPTEAEWEFAARGGTQSRYWWGDQFQAGMANCKNCSNIPAAEQPIKVGSFKPNPFGLYDMGGSVDQWVEDCWHKTYQGAPSDGSAWADGDCATHVIRSGSWKNDERYARPANRDSYDTNVRYPTHGFRVALSP